MKWLDRAGLGCTLLLPLFLLHGRGVAEVLALLLALLFLGRSALARDWAWLRAPWVRLGAAWWGWLVLCSALAGPAALAQAVGVARFLLLAAALEWWVLRDAAARLWLARLLRWAALYIAVQCVAQLLTGRNLWGWPRGADGELTGPYKNPRAGAPLSRLLFPAVLPPAARWLARPGWWPLAGAALPLAGVALLVLIGQRMPLLLALLGLLVTALILPRLRGAVLAAGVAAGLLLGATSVVSPPAYHRLVTKFSAQMADFPDSHYGQIAARAVNIGLAHPLLGTGFDGFRAHCPDPAYFGSWPKGGQRGDGGGAAMCVQHPHNFFLQALVEGGVPGLLLFAALCAAWLLRLGQGLWREPSPLRAGLFVAALMHLWPVASTTAFTSMPLGGFFFVLLGLGLAEGRYAGGRDC